MTLSRMRASIYWRYRLAVTKVRGRPMVSIGKRTIVGRGVTLINSECISIGADCVIGKDCHLQAVRSFAGRQFSPELTIGDRVSMEDGVYVSCVKSLRICDSVLIAGNVYIGDNAHGYRDITLPVRDQEVAAYSLVIGPGVHIGWGAVIFGPIEIGRNAVVGANSVVTKDVAPFTVVAGAPARVVSQYDGEVGIWRRPS